MQSVKWSSFLHLLYSQFSPYFQVLSSFVFLSGFVFIFWFCPKINIGTSTVFEIYKFQKPLWACLGMPDHPHLKLHYQFVALTDMKLHAQNQLYTSIG